MIKNFDTSKIFIFHDVCKIFLPELYSVFKGPPFYVFYFRGLSLEEFSVFCVQIIHQCRTELTPLFAFQRNGFHPRYTCKNLFFFRVTHRSQAHIFFNGLLYIFKIIVLLPLLGDFFRVFIRVVSCYKMKKKPIDATIIEQNARNYFDGISNRDINNFVIFELFCKI